MRGSSGSSNRRCLALLLAQLMMINIGCRQMMTQLFKWLVLMGASMFALETSVEVGALGSAPPSSANADWLGAHIQHLRTAKSTLTTLAGLGQWFWYVLITGKRVHANAAVLETEKKITSRQRCITCPQRMAGIVLSGCVPTLLCATLK